MQQNDSRADVCLQDAAIEVVTSYSTPWLTAATPMDNPYCSCKLTRVAGRDLLLDALVQAGAVAQPLAIPR